MKRIMSLLLALAMLLSCAAAIAEESETVAIPEAKEGETVVEFWCGMWENWNQNWVKAQVDSWNAKEDRPFYVDLDGYQHHGPAAGCCPCRRDCSRRLYH